MRVSYSAGRTINIGNFESVRLEFGATDTVQDEETPAVAWARIQKLVDAFINAETKKIEKQMVDNKDRRNSK